MPTFSVILEDVTRIQHQSSKAEGSLLMPPDTFSYDNQRTETIDATDIDDAWVQARKQYYILKVDGPYTQIIDIEPGTIAIEKWMERRKQEISPKIGTAVAPPPLNPIQIH
jgi:hypothetical protein